VGLKISVIRFFLLARIFPKTRLILQLVSGLHCFKTGLKCLDIATPLTSGETTGWLAGNNLSGASSKKTDIPGTLRFGFPVW